MQRFSRGNIDICCSDDICADFATRLDGVAGVEDEVFEYVEMLPQVGEVLVSGSYHDYIELYCRATERTRIAVLFAHGGDLNGVWNYRDGECWLPIQNWINKTERSPRGYGCIVLVSCNAAAFTARSSRAILFHPDAVVSGDVERYEFAYTIIDPEHGEEIDGYTIDNAIERLRADPRLQLK